MFFVVFMDKILFIKEVALFAIRYYLFAIRYNSLYIVPTFFCTFADFRNE